MLPKLVALDGPLKGRHFVLADSDITIGRDNANGICVQDACASRQHCRISWGPAGRRLIEDLHSRNGTFVNSVPIQERHLEHGDLIEVGASSFLFVTSEEGQDSSASSIRLERDGSLETLRAIPVQRPEEICLNPEKVLATPAFTGRLAQAFHALLKIGVAIYAARRMETLAEKVLRCLCEVVPAGNASVMLFEAGRPEPVWDFSWERSSGQAQTVRVPAGLVERVFREGIAVLTNGAGFPDASELSVLAVPLFGAEGPVGVIYLDAGDSRVRFEEDHLQLATAIGVIAGPAMENARRMEWLESENRRLQEEIHIQHDMIGESPQMREIYRFISKVAPADSTVLISGESGTGKELVAHAIHRNSPRVNGPFVAINCAALTETLVESELFGHEKGSFTGAFAQKKGKLEVADGGTLFLDEIGELPLALQPKLLRVLQEREFERVGGTRTVPVNVRIIAATNRDLREDCASGRFRQDLYYRLNVVAVTVPPLRERGDDIGLLASYFASKFARSTGRRLIEISREVRRYLAEYGWPGNVRELENVIERAVVLGSGDIILPEDLPEDVVETAERSAGGDSYYSAVQSGKKQLVVRALQQARGNYTEAAKLLGIHANSLHRLIKKLNLKEELQKQLGA